ncbi:cytochrome P450 6k1-like isoform X2 [Temnothorax americanus]|uniref:cytochrome P450 6k1-like isoform X2 n=1 Tax=Temnothorax americanus TaxID=1964332 RepID=UPI004067584A
MLITLIFIVTVIVLFWIYARYVNYWKRRGVEFLTPNLIFGNFKDAVLFRSAPGWHIGDLHKMARPDAPFVGFYIFHKPCLLLRDPDVIKHFMIRDFDNFSDRHFAGSNQKDSIGMKNLFGLKNPAWKYLRTKITPTLTRGKLKQMLPLMLETAEPMMKYIKDQSANHDSVMMLDAQDLNYKYTTDLIASIALGTKIDSFYYPTEFSVAVQQFFYGFKRMVALVTVFFMPELVEVIGTRMLFNSAFVKKIFWTAMENRERTAADMVVRPRADCNPNYVPHFYCRYVDDIAMDAPCNEINNTFEIFNFLHERLQFTCEIGQEGRLNFLDVTIVIKDNRIIFDHFHKPTFSETRQCSQPRNCPQLRAPSRHLSQDP